MPPLMQFTRMPPLAWQRLPGPDCPVNWCGLCRRCNPPLFDVPDDVWLHYVGPEQRHQWDDLMTRYVGGWLRRGPASCIVPEAQG
jgi:hypothetical protein